MAHKVESMMYVGEVPWHGLGHRFAEPPQTIEEAMQASGLNWDVRLEPLYFQHVPYGYVPVEANAVIRNSDNHILGHHVGTRYTPLQNVDAFKVFEPWLESGRVHFETAGSLCGGSKVWILAILNGGDADIKIAKDDIVRRYILLSHSHDGTNAISYGLTPIRVVCNNTLTAATGDKASSLIKVRHTENAQNALADATSILDAATRQFEEASEIWKALAAKKVTSAAELHEWARLVLSVPEKSKEISTKKMNQIERIEELFVEGIGNKGKTWWDALNAVTQYYTWESGRSQDTRLTSLWYGANKTALDRALVLTMIAAGLKASPYTSIGKR